MKNKRINLSDVKPLMQYPHLIQPQLDSFRRLIDKTIPEIFSEINPIQDNTGKLWTLEFLSNRLEKPNHTIKECLRKELSYDAPLYYKVRLINKVSGEIKEQDIFLGDVPLMTDFGKFIINGVERVVIHQIVRAEGVTFLPSDNASPSRKLFMAKIIPTRGSWLTIDVNKNGVMTIRLAPKRPKVNLVTFLRAMGYSSNAEILNIFKDVSNEEDFDMIAASMAKDSTTNSSEAIMDIYRKLRPDVITNLENAKVYIDNIIFNPKRTLIGEVGRYQLNKKLEPIYRKEINEDALALDVNDMIGIIRRLVQVNVGTAPIDDVDHLANRRLRGVDELFGEVLRAAIKKIEKNVKDRMSIYSADQLLVPSDLLSSRPITTAVNEFFGTSTVSQFLDQINILAELSNLRQITASGPGGIDANRATFSIRDIHHSQYGRICPIETPDGPRVGVVTRMSIYARINDYGFIETPYVKVGHTVEVDSKHVKRLINRIAKEDIIDAKGKVIVKALDVIDEKKADAIVKAGLETIGVKAYITDEISYMDADAEGKFCFTLATIKKDEFNNITDELVPVRSGSKFVVDIPDKVDYADVDSIQLLGATFATIPFGNLDDTSRTVLSCQIVKQAVPLIHREAPIVGTGIEEFMARESGSVLVAKRAGTVEYVDAKKIIIKVDGKTGKDSKDEYELTTFSKSNEETLQHQTPTVDLGEKVKEGHILTDASSVESGESAIGINMLTTCMFMDGKTYEDGILISERVIQEKILSSVMIKLYKKEVRETKLGPEEITRDIPNVSENLLKKLDADGVVRIGAEVKDSDILIGCVAPKGEVDLNPEEKLLRAIFGDKAADVKDISTRVPVGEYGIVIDTQVLDRSKGDKLPSGVLKQVSVWVARVHNVGLGDKLSDMHSQKGVIAKVMPVADMPYLEDGTPIDIVLNPLFLKRMNVGLIKEMWFANVAKAMGVKFAIPTFAPINDEKLNKLMDDANVKVESKMTVYDGRTGIPYDEKIAVGYKYMLKLKHISEEKIHARSVGPYTIITQQPLGGKAQMGGQRFGEMEVWALQAYGAAFNLKELLTIKSDDIVGRSKAYDAIVHGQKVVMEGMPESFKVFMNELRSLGLEMNLLAAEGGDELVEVAVDEVVEASDLDIEIPVEMTTELASDIAI
ncbi:MAG: DNA-directed RNA polymerase subunit beta [bacterium]